MADETPLFCAKCSAQLVTGKGAFYVVKIEALADPSPPVLDDSDLKRDHRHEIEQLIADLSAETSREVLGQVCQRLTIHLCRPCYREWIERPAG